jgi:hypothetical protein
MVLFTSSPSILVPFFFNNVFYNPKASLDIAD